MAHKPWQTPRPPSRKGGKAADIKAGRARLRRMAKTTDALVSEIMDEMEHLHARIAALESWTDTIRNVVHKGAEAAKKGVHGATEAAKHAASTVKEATRARALTDHDLTELIHRHFPRCKTNTSANPAEWTFEVQGRPSWLHHAEGAAEVQLMVGDQPYTFHTYAALEDTLKALLKPHHVATAAEIRGYTRAILRQQAMLVEDY